MIRLFARLLTSRPGLVLGFAVVVTLALATGLPRLGFDMHPNATFGSDNQASKNLNRLHSIFGPDDNDLVVLVEGDGLLEWESLQSLRKFRDQIRSIDEVEFVASIFDLNKPHAAMPLIPAYVTDSFDAGQVLKDLRRHPVANDHLISADGNMLMLLVRIRGESLAVSVISRLIDPLN